MYLEPYQKHDTSSSVSLAIGGDPSPQRARENKGEPVGEEAGAVAQLNPSCLSENAPYFLIQGNKSSTPLKSGIDRDLLPANTSDHSDRLSRYAIAHRRSLLMSNWIRENNTNPDYRHLPTILNECGDYLVFRHYYSVSQIRLHGMISCKKHIICPLCAIRRGAKAVKAYLDKLEVIKEAHNSISAYLITFTVKNGDDLKERFHHLQTSMKNYNLKRSRANTSTKHLPVEANKALGAVWSYEFKVGENSGMWHPHAHAIWLCNDAPDQEKLREEWKAVTGDSFIVDVTPFYDQTNLVNGFLEVFKYAVKFSDMPLEQNWEGYKVLSGRRLVASFGLFRGVEIPEVYTDEPLETLPYVELFYRYVNHQYVVEKTTVHDSELPF